MTRNSAHSALAGAMLGCALIASAGSGDRAPRLLLNTTASAPLGLYAVTPGRFEVGDLVAVNPPPALAHWLAGRQYLPANVPLLKVVAAGEGQRVCGRDRKVLIDGVFIASAKAADRWGRPLPVFTGCRRLGAEVLLVNVAANSLDSRYFGPLPASGVIGRVRPLWTWEARR